MVIRGQVREGHFPVDQILQSVQIDHALTDIIVVDERDRLTIGPHWALAPLWLVDTSIWADALIAGAADL